MSIFYVLGHLLWLLASMPELGRLAKKDTLSKLFGFFSYIWNLLKRGYQDGPFFRFAQAVLISILLLKKTGPFRQDLGRLTYLKWHPKKIFEGFFCIFPEINTQNFVNNDPNLKISAYLMQNFMELDLIKFSDPKAQTKLV